VSSNQSPVANPDVLEILADTPFVVAADDLLSNDTDADGDSLTISSWGNADHVSVTRLSDGSFSITPVANYSGPASFTYTISDGNGGTSTTTVNISVVSEDGNTPPLAVDDSASMRQMVLFTLQGAGYEVVQACDGVEALELARMSPVDLVLTDVHMPRMDGITLVRELRGLESYKFVPMLILTTESSQERKMDGKRAGATGWIVKPFNPPQLLATVARVL